MFYVFASLIVNNFIFLFNDNRTYLLTEIWVSVRSEFEWDVNESKMRVEERYELENEMWIRFGFEGDVSEIWMRVKCEWEWVVSENGCQWEWDVS